MSAGTVGGRVGLENAGSAGVLGGVLLVLLAASPTIWRLRSHTLDAPGVYALMATLWFGLTSLAWMGVPDYSGPRLTTPEIVDALLVVAGGLAAFGLGVRLVSRARPVAAAQSTAPGPSRGTLVVAFLFAFSLQLLAAWSGHYGYIAGSSGLVGGFTETIDLAGALGGMVVLATALACFVMPNRSLRLPLAVFVACELAFGVYIGVKSSAIEPLLLVCLAFIASGRRLPWKAVGAIAAVTVLVVVPVVTAYRNAVRSGGESRLHALERAITQRPLHNLTSGYGSALNRFRLIDDVALIVAKTPSSYPYANGKKYWSLPVIVAVPRQLMPHKPALDEAVDFTHRYWRVPVSVDTAQPITGPGDLYRNFGLAGILVGLMLWGMTLAAMTRAVARSPSPRLQFIYLYGLLYVVILGIETDFAELLATSSRTLLLAAVVGWVLLPGARADPGHRQLLARAIATWPALGRTVKRPWAIRG